MRAPPTPGPADSRSSHHFVVVTSVVMAIGALGAAACGSTSTDEPATAGGELYASNCASCHGTDLRGTDEGPSHLSIVYEPGHHDDESFRSAIKNGARQHHWTFGDMAPVEGLDDDEIDAIIAYVRGQQEREGFEPYPP